jgi:hypothetical protein
MQSDNNDEAMATEARKWLRKMLDHAAKEISERGILDDPLIEVKPEWMLPFALLVGRARGQGETRSFKWFICGEVALDTLDAAMADSARNAIRSFAMKWQLDAERSTSGEESDRLIDAAQQLYPLAEDDRLWQR